MTMKERLGASLGMQNASCIRVACTASAAQVCISAEAKLHFSLVLLVRYKTIYVYMQFSIDVFINKNFQLVQDFLKHVIMIL
jgi:hypothetical protein